MAVLSVDLAYRRWSDLGIVVLSRDMPSRLDAAIKEIATSSKAVTCEILTLGPPGLDPAEGRSSIKPEVLAGRLNHLCNVRGIRVLVLDGPQAWKSRANGLVHARVSERQLNTAAKTGLPGLVKPLTYRPFAEFCMDVYDALCRRGWRRLQTASRPDPLAPEGSCGDEASRGYPSPPQRVLVESYPHAAWRSLGLKPLPSKRRARVSDLAEAYGALRAIVPFVTNRPPNHDQLQAIVGGLPGLALEENDPGAMKIFGTPPRREQGHWREGYIVLPLPPQGGGALRWFH